MGHGSYKASDWQKLKKSRGMKATSTANEIFAQNKVNEKFVPKFISVRESRDSADSPESTPIIIGFDATGSMGYLAAEIAKNSLNKTATMILEKRPVTDPHIMCAAFTEPTSSGYGTPIQVTQFEADIRVVEQLLDFSLGGGNRYSYDALVWYFAWKHTSIDSLEKRGKKGFLFCIGDEIGDDGKGYILSSHNIRYTFGDEYSPNYRTRELAELCGKKYEIFHIITGNHTGASLKTWEPLLPGRNAVVESGNIQYVAEVMISIMQLVGGASKESVISQWTDDARAVVETALSTIDIKPSEMLTPEEAAEIKAETTGETKPDPSPEPAPAPEPATAPAQGCPTVLDEPNNAPKQEKQGFFSKLFGK